MILLLEHLLFEFRLTHWSFLCASHFWRLNITSSLHNGQSFSLELVNWWCFFLMALRFLLRQLQETRVKFCRALDIIPQMVQLRMMYTTEKMKTTWFPAQSRSKSTRLLCPANFHKGISTSDIAPGFLRQSMVFYFSFLDEFYLHVRLTAPIISTLLYVWLHTHL